MEAHNIKASSMWSVKMQSQIYINDADACVAMALA